MANEPLLQLDLPGIRKLKSGKVREIFDLGDRLLFVATDRISAFDCIMPNGIPRKGEVLTQISHFWFAQTEAFQPNHLLVARRRSLAGQPPALRRPTGAPQHDREEGRSRWPSSASCAATWPARAGRNTANSRPSAASSCRPA